jgi:hypothetical protein
VRPATCGIVGTLLPLVARARPSLDGLVSDRQ